MPHSTHDLVLLAAVADRDPDPATQATVEAMIASCADCAAIAEDLRALALALADLPTSLPAPRDMRLTVGDATRLRGGGLWRAILRPFGTSGMPALRPLAGVLTTLGIAGILLSTVPLGFETAGTALNQVGSAVGGAAAASSQSPAQAYYPGPASSTEVAGGPKDQPTFAPPYSIDSSGSQPSASEALGAPTRAGATPAVQAFAQDVGPTSSGPSIPPLTLVSIVLLVAGVSLISLRAVARRID